MLSVSEAVLQDMQRPDVTAQQLREQQKREYGNLVLTYAHVRRSFPGGVYPLYNEAEDVAAARGRLAALEEMVVEATDEQRAERDLLARGIRLRELREQIKNHPYALRHAPHPSRPVEREAFLERIVQRELAPYTYEDVGTALRGRYVAPATDQTRYHFYNAADPSELHGRKFGQDHWTVNW